MARFGFKISKAALRSHLTAGHSFNWEPSWSPDGQQLAFLSDRNGASHLWVWERATGEVRQVSDAMVRVHISHVESLAWSRNGREILVPLEPANPSVQTNAATPNDPDALTVSVLNSGDVLPVVDDQAPRRVDYGFVTIANGAVRRVIHDTAAINCTPSPARTALACNVRVASSTELLTRLSVLSLQDGAEQFGLTAPAGKKALFSWSPQGRYLFSQTLGDAAVHRFDLRHPARPARAMRWPKEIGLYAVNWQANEKAFYAITGTTLWRVTGEGANAVQRRSLPDTGVHTLVLDERDTVWQPQGGNSLVLSTDNTVTRQHTFTAMNFASGASRQRLTRESVPTVMTAPAGLSAKRTLVYEGTGNAFATNLWTLTLRQPRGPHRSPRRSLSLIPTTTAIAWVSTSASNGKARKALP